MKILILLITVSVITGCGDSDNSQQNINSPLLGAWETATCVKDPTTVNMFSTGQPWAKGTYEFMQNGDIIFTARGYSDSTCTSSAIGLNLISSLIANFHDFGEVTLEEGISGNKINISIQNWGQPDSVDGFYTINNNTLCFSYSYIFDATGISVLLEQGPPIDFTTCLVPQYQP